MKKLLYLAIPALFITVACSSGAKKEAAHGTETTTTPTEQTQPAADQQAQQQAQPAAANLDETDKKAIELYLSEKKLNAKSTPSGLYYIVETEGKGGHPQPTSKVKVHYTGTLLNGTKFDSSHDRKQPIEFGLNQVIPGWTEGIPLFQKGGKGKLLIPSKLAYGPNSPSPSIPPNSVLVFDVELLDFK